MNVARYKEILLERLQSTSSTRVPRSLLEAAKLDVYPDYITDSLICNLSTHVLTEKVFDGDVSQDWSGDVTIKRPQGNLLTWILAILGMYTVFLSFWLSAKWELPTELLGLLTVFLAGCTMKTATRKIKVGGRVTIPYHYFRAFPEATFTYPASLGAPVRIAIAEPGSFTQEDGVFRD